MPHIFSIALPAALFLIVGTANAEDELKKVSTTAAAGFDKKLFAKPMDADIAYVCFSRRYDTVHLAQHARQRVSAMKLLVIARKPSAENREPYSFKLGFEFRDSNGDWDSSGYCNHEQNEAADGEVRLGCAVECDGGGISIGPAKDGDGAIVRIERVSIWQNSKSDDETSHSLEGGSDNGLFRLLRATLKECEALVDDPEQRIAMQRSQQSKP